MDPLIIGLVIASVPIYLFFILFGIDPLIFSDNDIFKLSTGDENTTIAAFINVKIY